MKCQCQRQCQRSRTLSIKLEHAAWHMPQISSINVPFYRGSLVSTYVVCQISAFGCLFRSRSHFSTRQRRLKEFKFFKPAFVSENPIQRSFQETGRLVSSQHRQSIFPVVYLNAFVFEKPTSLYDMSTSSAPLIVTNDGDRSSK